MRKITLILLVILTSCSKYDENTGIQLKSKQKRLNQLWQSHYIESGGTSVNNFDIEIEFENDNEFKMYYYSAGQSSYILGDWDWGPGKEKIELTYLVGDRETWEIIKLENDNLWVKISQAGGGLESYFEFKSD